MTDKADVLVDMRKKHTILKEVGCYHCNESLAEVDAEPLCSWCTGTDGGGHIDNAVEWPCDVIKICDAVERA